MTHRTFRLGFERDVCNSGLQLQLKDDYCDYWWQNGFGIACDNPGIVVVKTLILNLK